MPSAKPKRRAKSPKVARAAGGLAGSGPAPRWLLLFHQIPPAPAYLRVKVGRRLARIGALPLKNTVYVLPHTDGTLEDFQWVLREVVASGGDATLVEARFVDGIDDPEIERRFQEQRDEDYAEVASDLRALAEATARVVFLQDSGRTKLEADLARYDRRLEELATIDFFHAPGRDAPVGLLSALRSRLRTAPRAKKAENGRANVAPRAAVQGKTWVTRSGIHVDRIASAWLVRRFIDPKALFKFVSAKGYRPQPQEVRFDMFEAEFTHEGDLCTFEVLLRRLGIDEPGLRELAEIIHDIDLKDARYERAETAGVAAQIAGLCVTERSDDERLVLGYVLFDQLKAYFARKRKPEKDE